MGLCSRLYGRQLGFRVRLFNVLAVAGMVIGIIIGISGIFNNSGAVNVAVSFVSTVVAAALLYYTARSGRYQLSYMITIVLVFLVFFPVFFFTAGGYHSGMPSFFVFAVLFTVFMLEGKRAFVMSAVELVVYVTICVIAKLRPETVSWFQSDTEVLADIITAFLTVSLSLGICMYIHFRIYNQQQSELVAAREEALRLSQVKDAFLANMSHEIRTPINVMLGMTDMVLRDSRDETVNGYARKIQNAGNMLLVLVSNILDLSKIESGNMETHEDGYRTAKLAQELFELGAESARRRGLAFNATVDRELPAELLGDMPRIKQIVTNFISNAVKYTSDGSITLRIYRRDHEREDHTVLCVSLADTGIGIKREDLPSVFDAFTRIDLPLHQSIEGTGLGLAIAKELAERMNGDIYAESEYGAGSTFWAEIPQRIIDNTPIGDWRLYSSDEDDGPEESFTAPDARVLVVDDNLENLQTIQALLRRTLMHIDLAESGAQCLAAAADTDYHLILMDHMMPELDGLETLRRLHEIPGFRAPVIALTANVVSGTRERLLAEGFAAYITKPVGARELEAAVADKLALAGVSVTKRTLYPDAWVTPELRETLARDLNSRGVSLEEGLKSAGGDLPLLARMAEAFARNFQSSIAAMRLADREAGADTAPLRRAAHSLKSAAGYVGAAQLSSHARLIEERCGDGALVSLLLPVVYLEWERAVLALTDFAAHVRAVEPKAPDSGDTVGFDRDKLARYIELRVRRSAIRELERLIGDNDADAYLIAARRALEDLDFERAEHILIEYGVLEG